MKALLALAVSLGLLISTTPTTAQEKCNRSKSCDEALGYCLEHRGRNKLTKAELPCESSAAACRKTGVWRGKYMRGTPEVNQCRIFTPKG